jgi:hypothetical protein
LHYSLAPEQTAANGADARYAFIAIEIHVLARLVPVRQWLDRALHRSRRSIRRSVPLDLQRDDANKSKTQRVLTHLVKRVGEQSVQDCMTRSWGVRVAR